MATQERAMTDVKIFGEHDERTKEQMTRCMQYGSAVGGVLCRELTKDSKELWSSPTLAAAHESGSTFASIPGVLGMAVIEG
jgi:hypothetical protein